MTTVAEQTVDTLLDLGVDVVFTLCGNHILPLYEAMRQRGVRVVDTRTEASAVMAADAYGRISRRAGVALVTGGPGFTNTLTGILTARGNRSPVVLISGEGDMRARGRGSHQEADVDGLAAGIAKWSRGVATAEEAGLAVVEAFRVALGTNTGPVVLSMPLDVQRAPAAQAVPLSSAHPRMGAAPDDVVDSAAELVRSAQRPVVVARAGVWQGRGEAAVERLADLGLPIFTLDSARGIVRDSHPSAFGYGDPTLNEAAELLNEADVALLLGNELDFRLGYGATFGPDAAIVHVDQDLSGLGRTREVTVLCHADPAAFAASLADRLADVHVDEGWVKRLTAARDSQRERLRQVADDESVPFHPVAVASVIARVGSAADATFVLDCGEFVQWCRLVIPVEGPGRWLRLGPQSTCGAGLPYGIGAKAARPHKPVIVMAGDGGIGYHIADLETTIRRELPVVVVVGQDGAWGVERNLQAGIYGEDNVYASDLGPTDFVRVAEGFGAEGVAVSSMEELDTALSSALSSGRTTLIQVPVRAERSLVTKSLIAKERRALAESAG